MIKEDNVIEKRIQEVLLKSEISLILDTYDDIFSDFDPRPYSERALSVDFLEEAERASKDKFLGIFELNFLIPKHLREVNKEMIIRKRLKEHFRKHFHNYEKERKEVIKKGMGFTFAGIALMILATFFLYRYQQTSAFATFFTILFEPAGWFLFWEGLNQAIFESNKVKPKIEFYRKMRQCEVNFLNY